MAFLFIGTISKLSAQSIVPERDSYGTFDVLSPTASYAPRYEFGFYKNLSQRWILGAEVGVGTYGTAINYAAD